MNKDSNMFAEYLYKFLGDYLPNEKNASSNTISSYRDSFKLFIRYMSEEKNLQPTSISMVHISKDNLKTFLDWLENSRNCSIRSRNQRLAAFKSLLNYIQYKDPTLIFEIQKIQSMPQKKYTKREVSYMSLENLKILLEQPVLTVANGLRDAAMLTLMYAAALRVQELIELQWDDLRLDDTPYTVRVHGKGDKYRSVPLTNSAKELLVEYRSKFQKTTWVFYNVQRNPLTRKGVAYILNKYVSKAKINPEFCHNDTITCHVLRHTKATHMLQAGVPLIYIRDFLGHSSVKTTEIYAKLNDAAKFQAINDLSYKVATPEKSDWNADAELMSWLESL